MACELLGEGFCLAVGVALIAHQFIEDSAAEEAQLRSIESLNSSVAQVVARLDRMESAQRQRQQEPPLMPMVSPDARAIEDAGASLAEQLRAAAVVSAGGMSRASEPRNSSPKGAK